MEKELEVKGSRKYPQGKSFFLLSFLTVLPAARPEGTRVKNIENLSRKRYKELTQFHCRPCDICPFVQDNTMSAAAAHVLEVEIPSCT